MQNGFGWLINVKCNWITNRMKVNDASIIGRDLDVSKWRAKVAERAFAGEKFEFGEKISRWGIEMRDVFETWKWCENENPEVDYEPKRQRKAEESEEKRSKRAKSEIGVGIKKCGQNGWGKCGRITVGQEAGACKQRPSIARTNVHKVEEGIEEIDSGGKKANEPTKANKQLMKV